MRAKGRNYKLLQRRPSPIPYPDDVVDFLEGYYPGAEEAFKALVDRGVDGNKLKSLLWSNLLVVVHHGKGAISRPLVLPRHIVRRLPKRLQNLARIIEKLTESPEFSPGIWGPPLGLLDYLPKKEAREKAVEYSELINLPDRLRLFARYLEAQFRVLRSQARRSRYIVVGRHRFNLVDFVHRSTKKFFYNHIADLLTAACYAAGKSELVTETQLKMLYHRNKPGRKSHSSSK
jgi:hypothetical protein